MVVIEKKETRRRKRIGIQNGEDLKMDTGKKKKVMLSAF